MGIRGLRTFAQVALRGVLESGDGLPHTYLPAYLQSTPGTVAEDFSDAGSWVCSSGTAVANSTEGEFLTGTQSLKVTSALGTNGNVTKVINLDMSTSIRDMRIYLYCHDDAPGTTCGGITLFLSSQPGTWAKYFDFTLDGFQKGWNVFNIKEADWNNRFGDSFNDPMIRFMIRVFAKDAAQQPAVSFDRVEMGAVGKPVVLITFDDGLSSTYTAAYAYMKPRHVRGTVYSITNNIGGVGSMTAAQFQILNAGGWDIGNHTSDHTDLTTLAQADAQTKLTDAKTALDALGLTRASAHAAYPFGAYDLTVRAAADAAGMLTGRVVSNPAILWRGVLPYYPWNVLHSFPVNAAIALSTAEGYIDSAISKEQAVILLFHGLVAGGAAGDEWNISDFQALIDYIVSKKAQITPITISDLYTLNTQAISVVAP